MLMSHYYDSSMVSEMGYSRMGPFDLKVVLHQLNRGINHLLHGSQTLFAYTEFHFFGIVFSLWNSYVPLVMVHFEPKLVIFGPKSVIFGEFWQYQIKIYGKLSRILNLWDQLCLLD